MSHTNTSHQFSPNSCLFPAAPTSPIRSLLPSTYITPAVFTVQLSTSRNAQRLPIARETLPIGLSAIDLLNSSARATGGGDYHNFSSAYRAAQSRDAQRGARERGPAKKESAKTETRRGTRGGQPLPLKINMLFIHE